MSARGADTVAPVLLERDGELDAIERVLAAADDGAGAVLVVAAQAGLGKTALLRGG